MNSIFEIYILSGSTLPWGKYFLVFATSILKFFAGAIIAFPLGMEFWEIFLTTGLGSCFGTWLFTLFGKKIADFIARNFKRRKSSSFKSRRRIVKIWRKFGILGVAILAPFISPPIAVAVGLSFRTPPNKILLYVCSGFMAWAAIMGLFHNGIWHLINN